YVTLATLDQSLDQLTLPTPQDLPQKPPLPAHSAWQAALNALQQVIIVHHDPTDRLALVLPEQKMYFIQTLHYQLQEALWALLHRNELIYQHGLTQIIQGIKQYV